MAQKYIATYEALLPTPEYVVVFADNPEDAMMLARQEIGQMREDDLKNYDATYKVIRLEAS